MHCFLCLWPTYPFVIVIIVKSTGITDASAVLDALNIRNTAALQVSTTLYLGLSVLVILNRVMVHTAVVL